MHELNSLSTCCTKAALPRCHEFVSETAKYGDLVSGPRVINADTKKRMKDVLTDIQNGHLREKWIAENEAGKPEYKRLLEKDLAHPIEKVGKELRARMGWLNKQPEKKSDAARNNSSSPGACREREGPTHSRGRVRACPVLTVALQNKEETERAGQALTPPLSATWRERGSKDENNGFRASTRSPRKSRPTPSAAPRC